MSGGHGLRHLLRDVFRFHETFDHPIGYRGPRLQPVERVEARAKWVESEAQELREAKTIADQVDAYIDMIYFAIGGLVDIGGNPEPLWDLVQAANMAKVWPDGTVHRREGDNKVIKPPEWVDPGPAIAAEIERQIAAMGKVPY